LVTVTTHVNQSVGKFKTNYICSSDGATNENMVQSVKGDMQRFFTELTKK